MMSYMPNLMTSPLPRLSFYLLRFFAIFVLEALTINGWAFKTPLEVPVIFSDRAATSMLEGIAFAGQRLVTVGTDGHIVVSDDAGKHWRQVAVPVSTDLVAVTFSSPKSGWAVGHWGVV